MAPPQVADELIDALKKGLGSRLACSLPLPDYTAGEVNIFFAEDYEMYKTHKSMCKRVCFQHVLAQTLLTLERRCIFVHELVHVYCVLCLLHVLVHIIFTTYGSTCLLAKHASTIQL